MVYECYVERCAGNVYRAITPDRRTWAETRQGEEAAVRALAEKLVQGSFHFRREGTLVNATRMCNRYLFAGEDECLTLPPKPQPRRSRRRRW